MQAGGRRFDSVQLHQVRRPETRKAEGQKWFWFLAFWFLAFSSLFVIVEREWSDRLKAPVLVLLIGLGGVD